MTVKTAAKSAAGAALGNSGAEEQMAKFARGSTPWIAWLLGIPAAVVAFGAIGRVIRQPGLVAGSLAAVAVMLAVVVWKLDHSRRWWGKAHHAMNALGSVGLIAAAVRYGWTGLDGKVLVAYGVGGLAMTLLWNVRHTQRQPGVQEVMAQVAHPEAVTGRLVRTALVLAKPDGRVAQAAAVLAPEAAPQLTAPGGSAPAPAPALPSAQPRVTRAEALTAAERAKALVGNFHELTQVKAKPLEGASLVILDVQPWRIRSEVRLVPGRQVPKDIISLRETLASQNALPLPAVLIKQNPARHDRVYIDWVLADVLAKSLPWPGPQSPGVSIAEAPALLGVYEDRVPLLRLGPAVTPELAARTGLPEKNLSHLIYEGMNGSGKALDVTTPVPTPSGWTTMGEIRAGDVVFDEAGQPTRVTDAWEIRHGRPCYRITFSDGTQIIADADHQWLADTHASRIADANQKAKRGYRTRSKPASGYPRRTWPGVFTTGEMAQAVRVRGGRHVNYSIRTAAPLCLPDAALLITPYTLGAWLGDGTSTAGAITSADREIITEIEGEGWVTRAGARKGAAVLYGIAGLHRELRLAGLMGSKHIPVAYQRASESQRRALLAGLLDTDGGCTRSGTVEYTSTSERLARDVLHLVSGLGYKANLRSKTARLYGKDCGIAWTVSFTTADKVFRLPRKLARQVTGVRATAVHRYITAIEPVPSVPVRCIAVDSPSRLFLVGQTCIPTHNSSAARLLLADGASRLDIVEWVIDTVKKTQTYGLLAQAIDWFATTPAEARVMVRFLADVVIPARAHYLGTRGFDNWTPGCGLPYLRVTVEEAGIIANELDKLDAVLNSARSTGIEVNLSIQRAHSALLDTNSRAAFGDTMSFGAKELTDVFAMPLELIDAGADPSVWTNKHPGKCYYAPADQELERWLMVARTHTASAADLRDVIAEHEPRRRAWIEQECPDWQRLLADIDKRGAWAKRTTGASVLAEIERVRPRAAAAAPPGVNPPSAPEAPAVPGGSGSGSVPPGRTAPAPDPDPDPAPGTGADPDDGPEDDVALDDLDLPADLAAGMREDREAGIDPRSPVPDPGPNVDFGLPPGEPASREQSLAVLRSILIQLGDGHEFAPRDLYDEIRDRTGRSAGWTRTELGTTLEAEGLVRHDRGAGRYTVTLRPAAQDPDPDGGPDV
jgi:hypothetical protein